MGVIAGDLAFDLIEMHIVSLSAAQEKVPDTRRAAGVTRIAGSQQRYRRKRPRF